MNETTLSVDAFDKRFPTEASCREALRDARWPDGVACPTCAKKEKVYALKSKPFYWLCKNCKSYRFSVISGTIFENTKKPLKVWFKVAYLMLVAKKGRSALEIHRTMYGDPFTADYHTTWYMCTRLRAAMRKSKLSGPPSRFPVLFRSPGTLAAGAVGGPSLKFKCTPTPSSG